ncbi:hypothetical protein EV356DRAFT_579516 [Viridothelium virens]|uniref:Uncharacterized protein n=1 Tax=Viridothelium virens TaxID=1048519 RepID=A0A6A6GYY2_VIRVR|nr:hypothetical protein EV356DRAFT_579516 [Viridothelium virens]
MIAGDQLGLTGSIPSADKPLRWICLLALFPAIVLFPICDAIAPVGRALQYLGFVPLGLSAMFSAYLLFSRNGRGKQPTNYLLLWPDVLLFTMTLMHLIMFIRNFVGSWYWHRYPSTIVLATYSTMPLFVVILIHAFFSLRIAIHLIRAYLRSDSDRFTCLECGSHAIKRTPRHGAAWHEPSERPRNYDYVGEYGDDDEPLIGGSVN